MLRCLSLFKLLDNKLIRILCLSFIDYQLFIVVLLFWTSKLKTIGSSLMLFGVLALCVFTFYTSFRDMVYYVNDTFGIDISILWFELSASRTGSHFFWWRVSDNLNSWRLVMGEWGAWVATRLRMNYRKLFLGVIWFCCCW